MTKQPRVLLDCDGVLADFVDGWLSLINCEFDSAFAPWDVTRFDVTGSLGLSPEKAARAKRLIAEEPGFAWKLRPYPGAVEGVAGLRAIAEVYVVTSPWNSHPTWTHDRERWLSKLFDIPHSHVIHTSAKHVCDGDIFVDDKTDAVIAWSEAHCGKLGVQWQTPHNRLDGWRGPATNSWDALAALARGVV